MINKEIQLFILWGNSRFKENEIITDIKKHFELINVYEIEWTKELFVTNLTRLYGEKMRSKIKHCGQDKFLLITVMDNDPSYTYSQTLKGYEYVNEKTLHLKQKYRKLTGGGYKIHSTNDLNEVNHDLTLLLGINYEDYYRQNSEKRFDNNIVKIKQDIIGSKGWDSLSQLFYVLNNTCRYVVLRGFEDLPSSISKNEDIDLLVENFEKTKLILNATNTKNKSYSIQVKTKVDNQYIIFDLRYIEDNYYCQDWEEKILDNRIFNKNKIYTPDLENYFYSLIYHCLIHKKTTPSKYNKILADLFKGIDKEKRYNLSDYSDPFDIYLPMLFEYLDKNNYYCPNPIDKKLKLNNYNIEKSNKIRILTEKYNLNKINSFIVNKKNCSGFDYFFSAEENNKKLFVKFGGFEDSTKREYTAMNTLNSQAPSYFPKCYHYSLKNNEKFIAMDYIEGTLLSKVLNSVELKQEQLQRAFDSLYEIAIILHRNKFIHRDVNPNNLIIQNDGTLILFDFQHVLGYNFKEIKTYIDNPKLLRGLNRKYRPAPYVWNDMYSFYKIMLEFKNKNIISFNEKISDIQSKMMTQEVHFLFNKFPLRVFVTYPSFSLYKILGYAQKIAYKARRSYNKRLLKRQTSINKNEPPVNTIR